MEATNCVTVADSVALTATTVQQRRRPPTYVAVTDCAAAMAMTLTMSPAVSRLPVHGITSIDAAPTDDGLAMAFAVTAMAVAVLVAALTETRLALLSWPELQEAVQATMNVLCRQRRIHMGGASRHGGDGTGGSCSEASIFRTSASV